MKWTEAFVREAQEKLFMLGLHRCLVCGSTSFTLKGWPVLALAGNMPPRTTWGRHDPYSRIDYLLRLECETCGHVLLFDAEKFRTGTEDILTDDQDA